MLNQVKNMIDRSHEDGEDGDLTFALNLAGSMNAMIHQGNLDVQPFDPTAAAAPKTPSAGASKEDSSLDSPVAVDTLSLKELADIAQEGGDYPPNYEHLMKIRGHEKRVVQSTIDTLAKQNTDQITGDKLCSNTAKALALSENTFDVGKAYHAQITAFISLHSSQVAEHVINTAGVNGYSDYTSKAMEHYVSTQSARLFLAYPQYTDILGALVNNVRRWVTNSTQAENDISRAFRRLKNDDPAGPLAVRLKILIDMS